MAKKVFAAAGFMFAAAFSAAEANEANYLARLAGAWAGSGELNSMLGPVPLDCSLSAETVGKTLNIEGRCSGAGTTRALSASLRYDSKARAYAGSWRDESGGAALSGSRRGETLNLAIAGKTRGRMTLTLAGGAFRLDFLRTRSKAAAPLLSIAFQRS